jgi:phosphoglucomutase/phosphomannomutase
MMMPQVRDKDAGAAALVMAELALDQKRRNQTVLDYRDRLAREFGYFRNEGVPVFMAGLQGKEQMARLLDRLRESPPREVAGLALSGFEDLRDERGRFGPIKGATDFAARNVLLYQFSERARVALRPSGTEPKAKIYLEACSAPCAPGTPPEAWRTACREVDELIARMSKDFVRQALALIGLTPDAAGAR